MVWWLEGGGGGEGVGVRAGGEGRGVREVLTVILSNARFMQNGNDGTTGLDHGEAIRVQPQLILSLATRGLAMLGGLYV